MIVVERKDKREYEYQYTRTVKFLYNTWLGRLILKLLCNRLVANIVGVFMNSRLSSWMRKSKIRENHIDMSLYETANAYSYNAFFTRKLKNFSYDKQENSFISPADAKLLVLKIDDHTLFKVKGSIYSLDSIINNPLAREFVNGYAMIFRLDVNDYHRYCYPCDGTRSDFQFIDGALHTVLPIVYDKFKVFHQNCREWCVLHTKIFDDVLMVEVGALLVGKINNDLAKKTFKKGDEKGYFAFGGSTILVFVKENVLKIDDDILANSLNGKETIVKCGEKIGEKVTKKHQ